MPTATVAAIGAGPQHLLQWAITHHQQPVRSTTDQRHQAFCLSSYTAYMPSFVPQFSSLLAANLKHFCCLCPSGRAQGPVLLGFRKTCSLFGHIPKYMVHDLCSVLLLQVTKSDLRHFGGKNTD